MTAVPVDPVHPVTALLTGVADVCGRLAELGGSVTGRPAEPDEAPALWRGSGPVVLVGGFGTTDRGLRVMRGWLERLGYRVTVHTTGIGTGCGGRSVERLCRVVEAADEGGGVGVVAHSRGAQFARAATAAGARVRALVALGAPFDQFPRSVPALAAGLLVGVAGSLGIPGLASLGCVRGPCCAEFRAALRAPLAVPFTSVYTRGDQVVPWRSSVDDGADNVEVSGGHLGLLDRPDALAAVAAALAA
jgi:hypothetical protein